MLEDVDDPKAATNAALGVLLIAVLVGEGFVLGVGYLLARILFWALHLLAR